MVVFHGGTTPPLKLKVAQGFRGAGLGKLGKPKILSGGGTTDTVTTSKDPEVSATYLSRGGGSKYLYALLLAANEAIDLGVALELSEVSQEGKLTRQNARTQEVLVLSVPWHNVIGWKVLGEKKRMPPKPPERIITAGKIPENITLKYTAFVMDVVGKQFEENSDYFGTMEHSEAMKLENFKLTRRFHILDGV